MLVSDDESCFSPLTRRGKNKQNTLDIFYITFTFMHLADDFIQSDLQCTQAIHFLSVCVPWESNPQPLRC